MKKNLFIFSGLGTQYYGMGETLYQYDTVFKKYMDELDQSAQDLFGCSVLNVCYSVKKNKLFHQLFFSQSMLFMVQYSLAKMLMTKGISPDCILGYSLGEFVALAAADVVSPLELLTFIFSESKVIEKNCAKGSMFVIAANSGICDCYKDMFKGIDIISVNSSKHFIVSGMHDDLLQLSNSLKQMKIMNYQLPVEYAFHTQWMESAKDKLSELLQGLHFKQPQCLLLSSLKDFETIIPHPDYFWQVIRQPIYFRETLQKTFGGNYLYIDCSPSGDGMNLIKHNGKKEVCFPSLISRYAFKRNSVPDVMQMVKTIQMSVFE